MKALFAAIAFFGLGFILGSIAGLVVTGTQWSSRKAIACGQPASLLSNHRIDSLQTRVPVFSEGSVKLPIIHWQHFMPRMIDWNGAISDEFCSQLSLRPGSRIKLQMGFEELASAIARQIDDSVRVEANGGNQISVFTIPAAPDKRLRDQFEVLMTRFFPAELMNAITSHSDSMEAFDTVFSGFLEKDRVVSFQLDPEIDRKYFVKIAWHANEGNDVSYSVDLSTELKQMPTWLRVMSLRVKAKIDSFEK